MESRARTLKNASGQGRIRERHLDDQARANHPYHEGVTRHFLPSDCAGTAPTDTKQALFAGEIAYTLAITLTKLSILCFYLSVFPFVVFPALRTMIYATMVVTAASGIAFSLAMVFQCWPVDSFWNFLDYNERGEEMQCINLNACGWAHGIITILLDLWLMALPMPELLKLTLPWRKKLRVCLMFAMGGFVTLVEIPRLAMLQKFGQTLNPTCKLAPSNSDTRRSVLPC